MILLLCSSMAIASTLLSFALRQQVFFDDTALEASRNTLKSINSVATLRRDLEIPIDKAIDPANSGLIGIDNSDLTTTLGSLHAKQTSLNPRFSGLIVMWLKQAGVRSGDLVAVSFTGSFPALNLAVLNACKAMNLRPFIISSVGASSFGANIPGFTWLDIEKMLNDKGQIPWMSKYASLGGIVDTQGGIDGTGLAIGEAAITRHGAQFLHEDGQKTLIHDIDRRKALYFSEGRPKAFINVGGGITALGWIPEAALLDNGLLKRVPYSSSSQRGLIFRMHEAGVSVIHLLNIERLAAAHHFPISPVVLDIGAENPSFAKHEHLLVLSVVFLTWLILGAILLRKDIS